MDKFKQRGVGSIAWYLNEIKNNPDRKGVGYLSETRGIGQWGDIKACVDFLVDGRYVERITKDGAPLSTRHKLTSFGHRYLEEHKQQLEGELGTPYTPPEEKSPISSLRKQPQTVEEAPVFKSPLTTNLPDLPTPKPKSVIAPFIPKDEVTDEKPVTKKADTVIEVAPNGEAKETTPSKQAAEQVGKALERLDNSDNFDSRFHEILSGILVERYADQVSARDILNALGGKPVGVKPSRPREVTIDSVIEDVLKLRASDPGLDIQFGFSVKDGGK